jgi:hypothetical protein
MPVPTNPDDVTMSISMGRELRLALEQVRLLRGRRCRKMPSLRSLIEEAVQALVARETATSEGRPSARIAATSR